MPASYRLTDREAADLVATYRDTWHADIRSTEPADRPRAEAAIRSLYRGAGRHEPEVLWVSSPRAGMLAAGLASQSQGWIRGEFTRGDIGNGANQDWNALANPFEIDHTWGARLHRRVENRIARWHVGTENPLGVLRAFGIDSLNALHGQVVSLARQSAPGTPAREHRTAPPADAIDQTAGSLLGGLWTSIVETTGAELARVLFHGALERTANGIVRASVQSRDAGQAMQPGQFDLETPILAAMRDCFGDPLWRGTDRDRREAPIDARLELARSAGPWWALDRLAILSERPLVSRFDDRGRLHSDEGPAMAWSDGLEMWAIHGVRVEPRVVTNPEQISIEMIDGEANTEVRRVLVERFGAERLIREGEAELLHEDELGKLWRRELPTPQWTWPREEPIVMVEVLNSTPEPDATRRIYFLRVPPTMTTARQAVAWTFGLESHAYEPVAET